MQTFLGKPMQTNSEAQRIAYQCGIMALAPIVQRLIDAEAALPALQSQIQALECRVEELEKVNRRAGARNKSAIV